MNSKEFQMEIPYKIVKSKAQKTSNKRKTSLKELSYLWLVTLIALLRNSRLNLII